MMARKNIAKKAIVLGLAFSMAIGGATGALAKGNGKHPHGKGKHNNGKAQHEFKVDWQADWFKKGRGNKKIEIKIDFKDIGIDLDWARQHIQRLVEQKILDGYGDGTFKPQQHVSRLEAIVMAVRLMNLRDEAESEEKKKANLNFKDANKIDSWARGYVAVALENDLFIESEDKLHPDGKADRLWVTTLLVKALGLDGEARAKMTEKLPFKDAAAIPAGSVGYVAVAIEKGIVKGYNDNTFQPNRKVTRAEIATFLDRAGGIIPDHMLSQGTLKTVVENNIVTLTNGTVLAVDPGAFVYRNNVRIALSDLKAGDSIRYRTYNNVVIFIEVVHGSKEDPVTGHITGELTHISGADLKIRQDNGSTADARLADQAIVIRDGSVAAASALRVGDRVTAYTEDGKVRYILATSSGSHITQVEGYLAAAIADSKLSLWVGDVLKQYAIASNATITRNGVQVNASQLIAGDRITAQLNNDVVISITAKSDDAKVTEVKGVLASAVSTQAMSLLVEGKAKALTIAANATITRDGKAAEASALTLGDLVTARVLNDQVISITAQSQAVNVELSGTLASAVKDNILSVYSGNQRVDYVIGKDAHIVRKDKSAAASELKHGDELFVLVRNNVAVLVNVNEAIEDSEIVSGTIGAISGDHTAVVIQKNGTDTAYLLDGATKIYRDHKLVAANQLKVGDVIFAKTLANNKLTFVQVTENVEQRDFTINGLFHSLTLNSAGQISTISVTQVYDEGTQVTVYNVAADVKITGNPSLLVAGNAIELKGSEYVVKEIVIMEK